MTDSVERPSLEKIPEPRIGVLREDEVEAYLPRIAQVYIQAFAGEPWYEVSMCADENQPKRCASGFSPLEVGEVCPHCQKTLTEAAYKPEELQHHMHGIMQKRPTAWYVEETLVDGEEKLALTAFAWTTTSVSLVAEKYKGDQNMLAFFEKLFPQEEQFMWLDEIFADRRNVRPEGNMKHFRAAMTSMARKLGVRKLAFRTINPKVITPALRSFSNAKLYQKPEVPDWRSVIVIDVDEES